MNTAGDILAEAQDLLSSASAEVRFRTIIGRAYYACFHGLTARAKAAGFVSTGYGEDHGALIDFLFKQKDPDLKACARKLNGLRKLRRLADYNLRRWIQKTEADEALLDAEDIFEILKR